jgi:predicted RND superfamily exporter protein
MGNKINENNKFIKFAEFIFGRKYGPKEIDRTYFCNKVEEVFKKYEPPFKIYFAGVPVFEQKSKIYMKQDIVILLVPILIIMTIVFFLSLKTFGGTILPIISISLSIVWTMGIIGWIRYKLDTVGILMPPVIMTVGSSYTLHYLNSYYNFSSLYKDKRTILINSTKAISPTISLAALTTIFGFASFVTARIIPIRAFGIFIVISIIFTLFFTYFLISKIILKLKVPKIRHIENVKKDFFSKVLGLFRSLVIPFRFFWVGIFILCIVLFYIFIPKLKIQTNAANLFKKTDIVRQSLIYLQYHFHGTNHYNITLRAVNNKRNFFKTKEGILAAKKIQDYLDGSVKIDNNETMGWILSPVTLLQDLNYVMTGERGIPEEKDIKRFFSILQAQATRDDGLKSIINSDLSAITFQVRPNTTNAKEDYIMTEQELAKLTVKLNEDLKRIANEDGRFTVEIWGEIILLAGISKYLVKDQIWSLSITAILVFLINLIMFRSAYYALLSLIPLSFGVLMNFTIMSMLNIPLDAATVMIAAISIGIGIDNSIHFILNYRRRLKENMEYKEAILETLSYTARPMLFTSLALILGFIIFILSSFRPVVFFGILISVSMLNCIFATLFILPSFFLITEKIRFLLHKKNK